MPPVVQQASASVAPAPAPASAPAPAPAPAPVPPPAAPAPVPSSLPGPGWVPGWLPVPSQPSQLGYLYPPPPPPPPPPPTPPPPLPLPPPADLIPPQRSRQTRHQDAASRSRQGHIIDLDPTDGLPVQRYGLQKVRINQDASTDLSSTNPKSTSSAEWAAQFNTEQHPWPERPLPSYFHSLPSWNQEMIRMARAGNTNPTLSTFDRKTNTWISGAEQERKAAALKIQSLNIVDPTEKPQNGNDADSSKSGDESGAEDSSNEFNKSADEDEFDGDETTPFKPSSKRRKVASRHQGSDDTRIIEVTRWIPLPPSQADKAQDKIYLAPRRPGMPALYSPENSQRLFGRYHSSASLTGTSGYDLGEGGGLSNASGVLASGSTNDPGTATPRKNIPPRRKKKKLGGPGRKKANPNPDAADHASNQQNAGIGGAGQGVGADAMEGVTGSDGQTMNASGITTRNPGYDGGNDDSMAQDDGDNDNDSGSEAEGSEEGEIDESGSAVQEQMRDTLPTVSITAAPVPTSVHDEVTVVSEESTGPQVVEEVEVPKITSSPPPAQVTTTTTELITEPLPVSTLIRPTDTTPGSNTPISASALAPITATLDSTPTPSLDSVPQPEVTITDIDTNIQEPATTVTATDIIADTDTAMPDIPAIQAEPEAVLEPQLPVAIPEALIDTTAPITMDANLDVPPPETVEEEQIVEETARTITDDAQTHIPSNADVDVEIPTQNETHGGTPAGIEKESEKNDADAGEIDFLGDLDAAIDREVSESG